MFSKLVGFVFYTYIIDTISFEIPDRFPKLV